MSHLVLELALWIILAFFVGCILGCLTRRLFAGDASPVVAAGPSYTAPDSAAPIARDAPVATTAGPASAAGAPVRPMGIAAARNDTPDDLQRISGVGPKNEKTLHSLGFFHF